MEGCLLCLDINTEFVDCIKVDSKQWQEQNIKNLIEKHLWIMETFLPSSWICNNCWQALYDFHKFYKRVEEAHMDFGKIMQTEIEQRIQRNDLTNNIENKNVFVDLNESYLEPDVILNQLEVDEDKSIKIKKEHVEDFFDDDDDIPLIQQITTRRQQSQGTSDVKPIPQDPLKKSKKSKSSSKYKNNKKETDAKPKDPPRETIFENSDINLPEVKQDPDDTLQMIDKSEDLANSSDSDNIDSHADYDFIPEKTTKRPKGTAKNKTPRKLKSKVAKTDSEKEEARVHKQIENDKFLAENFKMSCVLCQIPMENFKSLVSHFELEHKERGYAVCCNKKFYKRFVLVEHVQYHIDPTNFKCNECGKVFTTKNLLENHETRHLPDEEKKFPCTECGKKFAKQKLLSFHIKTVHLKKYLKICEICGQSLRGDILERHMLEHEGKSIPQINCQVCGKGLSTKKALKRHMETQHPVGERIYHTCHICFKISPNIHALRRHIEYVHTENLRKCTMCGRGFKSNLALKEHMATHTGIALYTCPWCPKTFNANAALHLHRKKLHPVEWEESRRQKILENFKPPSIIDINNSV